MAHVRSSPSYQLGEVAGQHRSPERPVVVPLRTPRIDSVGHAFAAEDSGHPPRLTDVLVGAFAAGQDDEPLAEAVPGGVRPAGKDVESARMRRSRRPPGRRRSVADRTFRSCRSRRGTRRGTGTARDRVERTDRRTGGDDLDVVTRAVGTHRRHHFVADVLEELPLDPRLSPAVAFACEQHATVDAVDRIELHPAGSEQVAGTRQPDGIARSPRRRLPLSGTRAPGVPKLPQRTTVTSRSTRCEYQSSTSLFIACSRRAHDGGGSSRRHR